MSENRRTPQDTIVKIAGHADEYTGRVEKIYYIYTIYVISVF